ncbi:MAG: hypothetical protein AAFR35_14360 [Pseudomonadota bacterium]
MSEIKIRETLGVLIVIYHFGLIGALSYFWYTGGFSFDEFTTTLAILIPVLSGYVAGVVSYFSKKRFVRTDRSRMVSRVFIGLSIFFPSALTLSVGFIMYSYAYGSVFSDFEQFKLTFAAIEGVFATYLATTANSLFRTAPNN